MIAKTEPIDLQFPMPIYEFYCKENNTIYSFLAKSLALKDAVPKCPDNASYSMAKRVSGFAFVGKAKELSEGDPMEGMDDAKVERMMAELEKDMAGFDEDNPNPKQMAHLMRKMVSLTGEKLPGEMEEMVARLEAGEDPEQLEEEFGDALDDLDGEEGGRLKKLRKHLLGPKQDHELYDMGEYCD